MIDTHTHLNDPRFVEDRMTVRQRARAAGVTPLIVAGFDLESSRVAVRIARDCGDGSAVGIHPHDAEQATEVTLEEVRALAGGPNVVAVGETGLDYFYHHSTRESQHHALRAHIRIANDLGLPLILHCREAYDDLYRILSEESARAGVAHCFFGTRDDADRLIGLGLHLGVGGAVTFRKNESLRSTLKDLPRDRLLLETDCPYMTPVPHRGERNEPAFLTYVADGMAELFGVPRARIEEETTANALRCFPRLEGIT